MSNKHKRILWLLNHRTLMPYECSLIERLGFEVFVPKIIPEAGFRSGLVDYSYDAKLSVPKSVLERLNGFNFYEKTWTTEITTLVNRYFGAAFVMPFGRQFEEAVDNFEGQLVLRAFGLDSSHTYGEVLHELYGTTILRKLAGIKSRFWFGEGYDNLHEIEGPVFSERKLFLPLGVPDRLWENAGEWQGTNKTMLLFCPNVVTDPYYRSIYTKFNDDFGDMPHLIVGAQDTPIDDPTVLGFVTDDQLTRLYLECSVLYYPSREPRHIHYSPIEAAIKGMPVIFFDDSLMGRISRNSNSGRVTSVAQARGLITRILAHDKALIEDICNDQREISFHFSDAYCAETWKVELDRSGFIEALRARSKTQVRLDEIRRTLLKPLAHGRTKVDPHRGAGRPARTRLTAAQATNQYGGSLADGVDFTAPDLPKYINDVFGVGAAEEWGSWSISDKVVVALNHVLEGEFRLFIRAFGYGPNAGISVPVKIGSQSRRFRLSNNHDASVGTYIRFSLKRPSNIIEIGVPYPTLSPTDSRTIGIGLIEMAVAPPVNHDEASAQREFGSCIADGIDFAAPALPAFVDGIEGISSSEDWGRWSTGELIRIELKHLLAGRFRLCIRGFGYGANAGSRSRVTIGSQSRVWRVPEVDEGSSGVSHLDFELEHPSNVIEISVPAPTSPPGDARTIGIGLVELHTSQPD